MRETAGERAERERMEQGEWNMGIEKRKAQEQEERLERLSETLSDALSLKGAQKELSAYIRWEKA